MKNFFIFLSKNFMHLCRRHSINESQNKSALKKNVCVLALCIIFMVLNTYIAFHELEEVRISFLTLLGGSFLIVLSLTAGRLISIILVPCLLSFSLVEAYLSFEYGALPRTIIRAIIGTSQHEALSIIESDAFVLVLILLTFFLVTLWITFKNASFKPIPFIVSIVVLAATLNNSWYKAKIYTDIQRYNISEHGHWLRYFLPGVLGDIVYIVSLYVSTDNQPVRPHPKQDPSIEGTTSNKEKNIIIIVGESAFSGHHSTYGYTPYDTTPYMTALAKENKLCVVREAHSGANITRMAVPMLLSFYEPTHQQSLYNEKNLIELAHDRGYQTSWISSQEGTGEYARPYGYLSEYSDFIVRQDYHAKENHVTWHDESLLPVIEKRFSTPAPYKFVVIHLLGSHAAYSDDVTEEDIQALPNASSYDQSLHRTDRILHQIIQMADAKLKDYVLLYASDHGEILDGTVKGHAVQYGGKDQYKIPFYIKSNTNYFCQEAESMRNSRGQYSSIMEKFLILDMVGYKINQSTLKSYYDHDDVLHSDGVVYDYDHLPHR